MSSPASANSSCENLPSKKTRHVCALGDRGVGKTAIAKMFVDSVVLDKYRPSMTNMVEGRIKYNNVIYTLKLLDTAGMDSFTPIPDEVDATFDAFIFVFSLSDEASFRNVQQHHRSLHDHFDNIDNISCILVGNKSDKKAERQVDYDDAVSLSNQWKCKYVECCAHHEADVLKLFSTVLSVIEPSESGGSCSIL
ncbi:hypothetical protein P9112_000805 [Eukaryota sp. TZLM1-RC]